MPIQIISATAHHHSSREIKQWFGEPIELISLSSSRRELMSREYILRVTAEIHEGVRRLRPSSRVFFLVTGHPYFNMLAFDLLRKALRQPFILMVYGVDGYEVFATNFVSELLSTGF